MNIILISIICYLGYIAGNIITFFVKEELKQIHKSLIISQKISFVLIIIAISYFLNFPPILSLFAVLASLTILFSHSKLPSKIMYPVLGVMFIISISNIDLLMIFSALVLIFGIVTGTLDRTSNKFSIENRICKDLITNLSFFIPPIIYLIF